MKKKKDMFNQVLQGNILSVTVGKDMVVQVEQAMTWYEEKGATESTKRREEALKNDLAQLDNINKSAAEKEALRSMRIQQNGATVTISVSGKAEGLRNFPDINGSFPLFP